MGSSSGVARMPPWTSPGTPRHRSVKRARPSAPAGVVQFGRVLTTYPNTEHESPRCQGGDVRHLASDQHRMAKRQEVDADDSRTPVARGEDRRRTQQTVRARARGEAEVVANAEAVETRVLRELHCTPHIGRRRSRQPGQEIRDSSRAHPRSPQLVLHLRRESYSPEDDDLPGTSVAHSSAKRAGAFAQLQSCVSVVKVQAGPRMRLPRLCSSQHLGPRMSHSDRVVGGRERGVHPVACALHHDTARDASNSRDPWTRRSPPPTAALPPRPPSSTPRRRYPRHRRGPSPAARAHRTTGRRGVTD
jgi:hypothetical protein